MQFQLFCALSNCRLAALTDGKRNFWLHTMYARTE